MSNKLVFSSNTINRLLSIWTSKTTTLVFLLVGFGALAVSIAVSFGQPSPVKTLARFLFLVFFAAHFATVYPSQIKNILFGSITKGPDTDSPLPADKPFYLLIASILFAFGFFGIYHVAEFLTVDEPKWLVTRIPDFFNALIRLNWHELLISTKPGVTLAWLVETGLLFTGKEGSELLVGHPELLFLSRVPLILFNVLALFVLTVLVRRLSNTGIAVFFLALTATNPTIMGMASVVNPDSISWFFPIAVILSFLLYLRDRRPSDLILASLFFTGGVLNKFSFLIVLPLLPLTAVLYYLFLKPESRGFFRFSAITIARLYLISWGMALIFWPYLILRPHYFLRITIMKPVIMPFAPLIIMALLGFVIFDRPITNMLDRLGETIKRATLVGAPLVTLSMISIVIWMRTGLPSIEKAPKVSASFLDVIVDTYFYHFYSQTTFTVLLYVAAALILPFYAFRRQSDENKQLLSILGLSFIVFYIVGSTLQHHVASARYQIPVFPFVALFIATVLVLPLSQLKTDKPIRLAAVGLTVLNLGLVLPFMPSYLLYYNHFLPKKKLLIKGWGYGGYEAAQYLNKKPDSKKLKAYASYGGFKQFFRGQTFNRDEDPFSSRADYLIIFKSGENKTLIGNSKKKNRFLREQAEAEFQMIINEVPVVKVIKLK